MCLISAAPKGTDKYSEFFIESLKSGAKCNTAGMGYTYKKEENNKEVFISKGYFNITDLLKSIEDANLQPNDQLLVHQRIATSGNTDDKNCHPFVISKKQDEILTLNGWVKNPTIVHNGIFRQYEYKNSVYSDTYHFVHEFMSNEYLLKFFKDNPEEFEILFQKINFMSWNKIALMFPDKGIVVNDGFITDTGYLFSNEGYCNSKVRNVGGVNTVENDKPRTTFIAAVPKEEEEEETKKEETTNSTPLVNKDSDEEFVETETNFFQSFKKGLEHFFSINEGGGNPLHISVTAKNFNELLFVSSEDFSGFKKGDVLEISGFTSKTMIYLKKLKEDLKLTLVSEQEIRKNCKIYPKRDFARKYAEYRKMVADIKNPSLSFHKKIGTAVDKCKAAVLEIRPFGHYERAAVAEYRNQLEAGFKPYLSFQTELNLN